MNSDIRTDVPYTSRRDKQYKSMVDAGDSEVDVMYFVFFFVARSLSCLLLGAR
jgi:hypothetical protein